YFFFEKKKQKTFARCSRQPNQTIRTGDALQTKVFWFFFSKKNTSFLVRPIAGRREYFSRLSRNVRRACSRGII
ncbi:MAG TPA: hypothetical protein VMB71_11620, partial [Acetobacteraceae bacterium]|nr:hypothetical protein [Acetobacteraceae bacterium]